MEQNETNEPGCLLKWLIGIGKLYLLIVVICIYIAFPIAFPIVRHSGTYRYVVDEVVKSPDVEEITGKVRYTFCNVMSTSCGQGNCRTFLGMRLFGAKKDAYLAVVIERTGGENFVVNQQLSVDGEWIPIVESKTNQEKEALSE